MELKKEVIQTEIINIILSVEELEALFSLVEKVDNWETTNQEELIKLKIKRFMDSDWRND